MIRNALPILIVVLLFPGLAHTQTEPKMRTVTQVLYGDTLELDGGEIVRLIGVEAPKPEKNKDGSLKKPGSALKSWIQRSREFTQGLIGNRKVWLESGETPANPEGQTLAYVFMKLENGQSIGGGGLKPFLGAGTYMINRLILNYGFATAGGHYPFKYRSEFRQLEMNARERRIGLFQSNF